MDSKQKVVCLDDYEAVARHSLSESAYEYVASGAAEEQTLKANRSAFQNIGIFPRVLVDVSILDTRVTLFGREHVSPILLAPTGYHRLVHERGEMESIDGANLADCTMVASSFATVDFQSVQRAALRPQWFQLYIQNDRGLTRDLVEKVLANGCEAICVTVDLAVNAARDREARVGFEVPSSMRRENLVAIGSDNFRSPHSLQPGSIYNAVRAANATWRDIEWLRSFSPVPLLLKGVLRADDADIARSVGCDGLIVSNHGGRALDGVEATIDALPRIADKVGDNMTLLLDGGIRRGTDVLKALARGADAILIGRPYLFALATAGAVGMAQAIEILRTELRISMGLAGCPTIASIDRSLVT
jgi:4-hydroxymandelate oxidase